MFAILACFLVGAFLPMIIMGIQLSVSDMNEKRVYYGALLLVAILLKIVVDGAQQSINIPLIIIVAVIGLLCFKAHDQVFSALGKVSDLISNYMQAINRMSMGADPSSDEGITYSLSMRGIMENIFKIEVIILICSAFKLITYGCGLSMILGSTVYLVGIHGFLLQDEILLKAVESLRRSIRAKLKLLEPEDEMDTIEEGTDMASLMQKVDLSKPSDKEESDVQSEKEVPRRIKDEYLEDEDEDEAELSPLLRRQKRLQSLREEEDVPLRRESRLGIPSRMRSDSLEYDDDEDDLNSSMSYRDISRARARRSRLGQIDDED